jgi:hypothetical protein
MMMLTTKSAVVAAGLVCQSFSVQEPEHLPDCRSGDFHQSDVIYEVLRNGQQFEAQFIEKDWAKEYIYKDETSDCFTIKETKICQWGK